jgi:type VI secretion system protein ImpB
MLRARDLGISPPSLQYQLFSQPAFEESMSSSQDKLGRVRTPRVHLRYDVQVGEATVKKEIPFLMGVVGDFSGTPMQRQVNGDVAPVPASELKHLRDRKFVDIDRDNFDAVLKKMTPGVSVEVENTLKGDGTNMKVNLAFESMKDFDPGEVAKRVPALKKLLDIRDQLMELKVKTGSSPKLEAITEEWLKNTADVEALAKELGLGDESSDS